MRDTKIHLVGPFATIDDLRVWGYDPANNPEDDPRWQSIQLTDEQLSKPLTVVTP